MPIDTDKLRKDIREELYGIAFWGGFGGALIQTIDVNKYTDEEIVRYAIANGIDISKYANN